MKSYQKLSCTVCADEFDFRGLDLTDSNISSFSVCWSQMSAFCKKLWLDGESPPLIKIVAPKASLNK